jgi:ABC-type Zn uptake system ZnuABC Zn-binding protein ZnuA
MYAHLGTDAKSEAGIPDAAQMLLSQPRCRPSGTVSGMGEGKRLRSAALRAARTTPGYAGWLARRVAYEPPGMDSRRVPEGRQRGWPALALTFLSMALTTLSAFAQEKPLILTSLAPVYELTAPLLENTNVDLQLLPGNPRSMQTHQTLFVRQIDRYAEAFAKADAVISIGKLWTADPLYVSARQFNPRVVDIDASKPYSHELDGVAVASSPVTGLPSPYFWLSPSNVVRILDIVGNDLQVLYPAEAAAIKTNQLREQDRFRGIKLSAETRLLDVDDPVVYALTDEFVYLTSDLGIFVAGYFSKQDIDWTQADLTRLTGELKSQGVGVVIHKWEPSEAIRAAITAGGARLVVLDTLETSADFAAGFEANLQALFAAWQAP